MSEHAAIKNIVIFRLLPINVKVFGYIFYHQRFIIFLEI